MKDSVAATTDHCRVPDVDQRLAYDSFVESACSTVQNSAWDCGVHPLPKPTAFYARAAAPPGGESRPPSIVVVAVKSSRIASARPDAVAVYASVLPEREKMVPPLWRHLGVLPACSVQAPIFTHACCEREEGPSLQHALALAICTASCLSSTVPPTRSTAEVGQGISPRPTLALMPAACSYLHTFVVRRDHRGHGLGHHFLALVLEAMRRYQGAVQIRLHTERSVARFYLSCPLWLPSSLFIDHPTRADPCPQETSRLPQDDCGRAVAPVTSVCSSIDHPSSPSPLSRATQRHPPRRARHAAEGSTSINAGAFQTRRVLYDYYGKGVDAVELFLAF